MKSNNAPIKTTTAFQSPFKKVTNIPNNIPKINNPRLIIRPNLSSLFQEKYFTPPFHFGLNFYFAPPKNNYYQPQMYYNHPKPQENYYPYYNHENMPNNTFKNSLAKSGYNLNQDQYVQFKESYNKPNNINNINYYSNSNYSINNNSNIINNIFPTFTKVTNLQIISDNDSTKNNEKKEETKKENINNVNSIKQEIDIKQTKKEENTPGNKTKKCLFECSETNGININNNNNKLLRRKRERKKKEELEYLIKFYSENKNWTKKQIKEISEKTGLKENKIYKWLWDQKNKEIKTTKFVVNK